MKKMKSISGLFLAIGLAIMAFNGCAEKDDSFTYSSGIDHNGFYKGIRALDYVELPDYESLSIPEEIYEVSEEAVQLQTDTILAGYAIEIKRTDRAVADGDKVNFDYVGTVDGVEFERGSIGSSEEAASSEALELLDEFYKQMIGRTPGESFDLVMTFSDDHENNELKGRDVIYTITINYISENSIPELTDEFVAEILQPSFGYSTVEEMKAAIRISLQGDSLFEHIRKYLIDSTSVTAVPDKLIEYQENALIERYQESADYYGMELDDFLKVYVRVSSVDILLEKNRGTNEENARFSLVIQAIAEDAGIAVSEDDVASYFKKHRGMEDYAEYEADYGLPYLKFITLQQAVMDHIVDNAVPL